MFKRGTQHERNNFGKTIQKQKHSLMAGIKILSQFFLFLQKALTAETITWGNVTAALF